MAKKHKSDGESTMDAKLWGKLQNHVALENIYAKVPFQKFFQLRLVCQEWNRLAGDRKFLEDQFRDLVSEPYFFLNIHSIIYLSTRYIRKFTHGLLTFDVTSGRWSWTGLYPLKDRPGSFALKGLIYNEKVRLRVTGEERFLPYESLRNQITPGDMRRGQRVFNVHTRVWYRLPRPLQRTTKFPVVGMLVDTSVHPYSFKVIQASSDLETQIYDSKTNSWEIRSSRLPTRMSSQMDSRRLEIPELRKQSSVNFNGMLYIKSEIENILVYDVNKDIWSTLREPPSYGESSCHCIGAWQGRLFGVQERFDPDMLSLWIWELVNPSKQEWKKYNQMPAKLYSWLCYIQGDEMLVDAQPYASISNNYVLIYSWLCQEARVERFVLFDLATKSWKAHLPFGKLSPYKRPKESENSDESFDDSSDEYDSPVSDDDTESSDDEETDGFEGSDDGETDGSEGSEEHEGEEEEGV